MMVGVAQWLEHMAVAHVVAGSNPVIHPKFYKTVQIIPLVLPANFLCGTPPATNRWVSQGRE